MIQLIKALNKKVDMLSAFILIFLFVTVAWAADTKLSAITNLGAAPASSDELYLNDAGTQKALTVANLMLYLGAAHDTAGELTALFAAKEVQLDNEAGLYAVLSDVALFLEDVVDDTTPQLGGDLDGQDYNIDTTNTIQGAFNVISDADGIILTAAQMNGYVIMTGAGEVLLPDVCDAGSGDWVTIINKTDTNQVEAAVADTGNDKFVLIDGTVLDVNDEVDLATGPSSSAKFVCLEANTWYQVAGVGVSTDGGVAD